MRPYLRVANVFDGWIDYSDVNAMTFTDAEFERYKLGPGDVLLNEGQSLELVGRAALFRGAAETYCFQNTLVRFTPSPRVLPEFAELKFQQCLYDGTFQGIAKKTTSIAHLGVSRFAGLELIWPPVEEQRMIVEALHVWSMAISSTEKLLENCRRLKDAIATRLLRTKPIWTTASFNELYQVSNRKEAQVPTTDYLSRGTLPIVDQGQRPIAGYTDDDSICVDPPMIVFGDHTRAVKWVDFRFRPGADGTQLLCAAPHIHPKFAYHLLANAPVPNLGYSRHMSLLKQMEFSLPREMVEQAWIAEQLDLADQAAQSAKLQIACLKLEKRALMQDLLTGKRRVRLPNAVTEQEAA